MVTRQFTENLQIDISEVIVINAVLKKALTGYYACKLVSLNEVYLSCDNQIFLLTKDHFQNCYQLASLEIKLEKPVHSLFTGVSGLEVLLTDSSLGVLNSE